MAKKKEKNIRQSFRREWLWVLLAIIGLACLYLILILGFWLLRKDVAYPGATVAGINVAGKNEAQIEEAIKPTVEKYLNEKIVLNSAKPQSLTVVDLGLSPDYEKTAAKVIAWGAENPFVLGTGQDFPVVFTVGSELFNNKLSEISGALTTPVSSTAISLVEGEIKTRDGQTGARVNVSQTAANILAAAAELKNRINVYQFAISPSFPKEQVAAQTEKIVQATKNPITLTAGSESYVVDSATLVSWVELASDTPSLAQRFGDDPLLAVLSSAGPASTIFSSQAISNYLTVGVAPKINTEPVSARLAEVNGALTVTSPSQNGKSLDVPASANAIQAALTTGRTTTPLVVTVKKPEVREDNLETLGIKELVSTGYSNFAGSPANRMVNIRVGASQFNGALISPNETFSFNTTLGPVDAEHGYLPELVILENKTTPQYGGGMCQVSSTAFRAALNAGMPILARTPHAYPVTYYKPYGVDATIYLPNPDLIFQNDTGHYILIQTHIEGTRLSFDFYGTKPNRTISFAGNADGGGAVPIVEQVSPLLYDQGARGVGSFTAQFWRFITDTSGKLVTKSSWTSKYDSPLKYPH